MTDDASHAEAARALKARADEARNAGQPVTATTHYKAALAAAGQAGDKLLMARILAGLGHLFADTKEHRLAIEAFQDGANLLDPEKHAREISVLRFNLGSVCLDYRGEDRWTFVMMASEVLRRSLDYFTERDHPAEYRATHELLLRADMEISQSPMAQAEVVFDD